MTSGPELRPIESVGADRLDRVIEAFVRRMAADDIIGFFFQGRDLARVIRHEREHAGIVLGEAVAYTGRPIVPLHRPLRINAGQFRRRLALLRVVAREHGVDEPVIEAWLATDRRLQAQITDGTDCAPPAGPPP